MKKTMSTLLPRLPEVAFKPLKADALDEMINMAVATRQMPKQAQVIAMPRPWMWGSGAMALAASVLLAVALAPKATVTTADNSGDFTDMLVLDSVDYQS